MNKSYQSYEDLDKDSRIRQICQFSYLLYFYFLGYFSICMLGGLTKNTLRLRKLSGDGFGGMHKMSVVQKKWASVYEDCEYLGLGRFLGFRHKYMHCGLGVMERLKMDCLVRCW